jgi:hypothetical protein
MQLDCELIFNGHTKKTIEQIDVETFTRLQTMYADGMLGNRGILNALGALTAGVFNYIRPQNAPAYKLENIIGRAHDYLFPPLSGNEKKQQVNNALINYMKRQPGAPSKGLP